MADELDDILQPLMAAPQYDALTPALDPTVPVVETQHPSPEQVHAAETYFQQSEESQAVAGVVALWTSAVLLKDLATEHFSRPVEEEERKSLRLKPEEKK